MGDTEDIPGSLLSAIIFSIAVLELILILVAKYTVYFRLWGPGSIVGIATAYRLDGPGIESRWGRDFPHLSIPALRSTHPPVQGVPGLTRG